MSKTNGAWLALGVAGAVAAAGVVAGRRGSSNRNASSLTDEQLELLLSPTTPAQQQRLMAQGVDVDWFLDHQGQLLKQATKRREGLVSKYLPRAGRTGADWSVSAWSVDNDDPRRGYKGERFIVLDDDDNWSLVRRFSREDENDDFEMLESFRSFSDLKRWLEKNAKQRGSMAHSPSPIVIQVGASRVRWEAEETFPRGAVLRPSERTHGMTTWVATVGDVTAVVRKTGPGVYRYDTGDLKTFTVPLSSHETRDALTHASRLLILDDDDDW